jgi:hypothetical protein
MRRRQEQQRELSEVSRVILVLAGAALGVVWFGITKFTLLHLHELQYFPVGRSSGSPAPIPGSSLALAAIFGVPPPAILLWMSQARRFSLRWRQSALYLQIGLWAVPFLYMLFGT